MSASPGRERSLSPPADASPAVNGASPPPKDDTKMRSRSPVARSLSASRSPVRERTYSRDRKISRSPVRRRSPSPPRRSPSPRRRSVTPRRRSPSPRRQRSRSRDRRPRDRSRDRSRDRYRGRDDRRDDRGRDDRGRDDYRRERRSSPGGAAPYYARPRRTPPRTGLTLFVAGLNFITTEREVESKFNKYGAVQEARIVRNPQTGESRGFGFVAMKHEDDVDDAIKALDGAEWNGRRLAVERARNVK